jgi:hypothetical protein
MARMKLTATTKRILGVRRFRRNMEAVGYEDISEGGKLWELDRGSRIGHKIVDVKIGPDGRTLFAKVQSQ